MGHSLFPALSPSGALGAFQCLTGVEERAIEDARSSLSAVASAILGVMRLRMDAGSRSLRISRAALAARALCSVRTVSRAIVELTSAGFVDWDACGSGPYVLSLRVDAMLDAAVAAKVRIQARYRAALAAIRLKRLPRFQGCQVRQPLKTLVNSLPSEAVATAGEEALEKLTGSVPVVSDASPQLLRLLRGR